MNAPAKTDTSRALMKRMKKILISLGCSSAVFFFGGILIVAAVLLIIGAAYNGSSGGGSSSELAISQYREEIMKYSIKYNLEPAFVYAIIETESNFNENAESGCKRIDADYAGNL